MLYRSNILAFVGGGRKPICPLDTVMIWDDSLGKDIARLKFNSDVKAVKLKSTK
jgi:WD repeat-containing protein 45